MKIIKVLISVWCLTAIIGCSSPQTVIQQGVVYTIKGDKILNNGVDVSKTLSSEEKNAIETVLKERLATAEAAEKKKAAMEAKLKELESVQNKIKAEQKALDKQLKEAQKKREDKQDAREDFLKANEKLKDSEAKYKKLHQEGKLSPKNEEKWAKKLKELQIKKHKAEEQFNNS